jgi:hypothetical protein
MARAFSGCEVLPGTSRARPALRLLRGAFANAALFHVPSRELPRVFLDLHDVKPRGPVQFNRAAAKRKAGAEAATVHTTISRRGGAICPAPASSRSSTTVWRACREQQPWLASVWRKFEQP